MIRPRPTVEACDDILVLLSVDLRHLQACGDQDAAALADALRAGIDYWLDQRLAASTRPE